MSWSPEGGRHPEELVSASLTGDLTEAEQAQLDRHLAACQHCQRLLASFREERRLISGLRHVPPPVDLRERVAAGIAGGGAAPWWQRPRILAGGVAGLAVAAAVLALAVLALGDARRPVADAPSDGPSPSPSPSATPTGSFPGFGPSTPTPTPAATADASATPTPAPTPGPTGTPTPAPTPAATPVIARATPDVYLAFTPAQPEGDQQLLVVEGESGETVTELEPPSGPPVNAILSPDGAWLAYMTEVGEKGTNEVWATRLGDGEQVPLGETLAGSPFLEQLSWSPDSRYLAYTLADEAGVNAWLFDTADGSNDAITAAAAVYAASFAPAPGGGVLLWLSVAGPEPISYLIEVPDDTAPSFVPEVSASVGIAPGVFLPVVSPDGSHAIYWRGAMQAAETGAPSSWLLAEGGAPYLAEVPADGDRAADEVAFANERPLFSDLTIGREAFAAAEVAWGADGKSFAVWDAEWMGEPQSAPEEAPYPDSLRIYFSNVDDPDLITRLHALDEGDLPDGVAEVTHVAVAADARHLSLTVRFPTGGALEAPRAALLLVTRNTGDVADEVEQLAADDGWVGPAVYRQPPDRAQQSPEPSPQP
ncbi:MAG TPA: zf-HC2 domain-containing protein [Candidatus Limnocylindria bacterium]|nr:zf-HC2 domain-containing protein [Candidatus Limnocylindria bacterium]